MPPPAKIESRRPSRKATCCRIKLRVSIENSIARKGVGFMRGIISGSPAKIAS
jgi:hypothetical protein